MSIKNLLQQTVAASRQLITLSDEAINRILTDTAGELMNQQAEVLTVNERPFRMDPANPKYDRLKLTTDRLKVLWRHAKCPHGYPQGIRPIRVIGDL